MLSEMRVAMTFKVRHPHDGDELPFSAKLVYGTFAVVYAFATGSSLRRGLHFREEVPEPPGPRDFYVHGCCAAAAAALSVANLLVLLGVRCVLLLPWLYCGRIVSVTCWVLAFGHANGAERSDTVRAAVLAATAVGLLGSGAVLARYINDSGVEQSVWPWMIFVMGCLFGAAAKQAVNSMSRNSLSWYDVKVQERIVTVSECVGYLCTCYAMLWVMTEGVPMLNEAGEATFFGVVDTLLIASNGAILMRAVEQNILPPVSKDGPEAGIGGKGSPIGDESSAAPPS